MSLIFRDNRGFSLIGVMMAAGISLIIMLGMTTMIVNQQRELTRLRVKGDLIDLQHHLRAGLSSNANCLYNLQTRNLGKGGKKITAVPVEFGLVNGLLNGSADGAPSLLELGKTNSALSGADVKSIKLVIESSPAANEFVGHLEVAASHNDFEFRPVQISGVSIKIGVDGTITDCVLRDGSDDGSTPHSIVLLKDAVATFGGHEAMCGATPIRVKKDGTVEGRFWPYMSDPEKGWGACGNVASSLKQKCFDGIGEASAILSLSGIEYLGTCDGFDGCVRTPLHCSWVK